MIAKNLRRLSKLYVKVLALQLPAPHSEYMAEAMLFISDTGGSVKQRQLVNFMEVDRRSLMPMLQELLDMGYLHVKEDPECIKEHIFSLTIIGEKIIPRIHEAITAADLIMEDKLGEMGLSSFKKTMAQMEANLGDKLIGYNFK